MKSLVIAIAMLFSTMAFASGKFTITPNYSNTDHKWLEPTVGLSVYEKFGTSPFAYNGWLGTGEPLVGTDRDTDLRWYTMKHNVEFYYQRLTVAPGFQIVWDNKAGFEKRNDILNVKFGYQLW